MMFPYIKTALKNLVNKPVTEAFPAGDPPKAAENYRGRLSYDPTKCINCGMCIRVCSPQCITRTVKPLENGDQEVSFAFDMASCTYCSTCADFCSQKAIHLTDDYMIVGTDPEDFMVRGTFIKKKPAPPKFTPEQIEAMKKAAAEKAAKAAAAKAAAAGEPAEAAKPAEEAKAPAEKAEEAKTPGAPAGEAKA